MNGNARFFMDGWDVRVFLATRPGYPRWVVQAFAPDGECYLEHSCGDKYPTKDRIGGMLAGAEKRYAEVSR